MFGTVFFVEKGKTVMHCPYCGHRETEVVETRDCCDLDTIRRRRSCLSCAKRFTTYERVETVHLTVIKKNDRREQFNREKLRLGLLKSCEKTKVSQDHIERIVTEVERELRAGESVTIASSYIGELIANKLKKLDTVAYIRFSSVFKRFVAAEDFEKAVENVKTITYDTA